MPEVWPSTVPSCANWSEEMGDGRLKSQNDTGPAKMRRRSTFIPDTRTGVIPMTFAQFETLRTFVKVTTLDGTLPFTIQKWGGAGTDLVRFRDLPSRSRLGAGAVAVNVSLEVLRRNYT